MYVCMYVCMYAGINVCMYNTVAVCKTVGMYVFRGADAACLSTYLDVYGQRVSWWLVMENRADSHIPHSLLWQYCLHFRSKDVSAFLKQARPSSDMFYVWEYETFAKHTHFAFLHTPAEHLYITSDESTWTLMYVTPLAPFFNDQCVECHDLKLMCWLFRLLLFVCWTTLVSSHTNVRLQSCERNTVLRSHLSWFWWFLSILRLCNVKCCSTKSKSSRATSVSSAAVAVYVHLFMYVYVYVCVCMDI
jgi:hypothetical protein